MKHKAFTLIELLVAIGIIALLAGIIYNSLHYYHPPQSPSYHKSADNMWIFEDYGNSYGDTFADDLSSFLKQHPNLKVISTTAANVGNTGKPRSYVVITEEKPTPAQVER